MVNIKVQKRIIKDVESYKNKYSYKLVEISGPKIFKDMFKAGHMKIMNSFELDYNTSEIGVYLVFASMVDNGDYFYNGEDEVYVPCYEEEYSYEKINFCPFTGEKINFEIVEEIDVSDTLSNILSNIHKCSKSAKKRQELYKEFYALFDDDLQNGGSL